ncbi:hypothetical protein [Planctomicrobium sp. SH527]|uniref:hypothetical protein n=1 Tax=Planctomicrobium sp. SH527 TaxID=3448123 RepID=UPI003F5B5A24
MPTLLSQFLDRLAERFTAIVAGVISSKVEGLHAATQAEQQSQLEDLARRYELEGKAEIAATLRTRALRLTSNDLAEEAVEVMQQTSRELPRLNETTAKNFPALLASTQPISKSRRKPTKPQPNTTAVPLPPFPQTLGDQE